MWQFIIGVFVGAVVGFALTALIVIGTEERTDSRK